MVAQTTLCSNATGLDLIFAARNSAIEESGTQISRAKENGLRTGSEWNLDPSNARVISFCSFQQVLRTKQLVGDSDAKPQSCDPALQRS